MRVDDLERVVRAEGRGPGEHLVEDRAQRIEVAPGVDEAVGAPELLGGGVDERSAELIVGVRGDGRTRRRAVEVDERRGVVGVEHHVGGVDVAMDHVARVHVGEDLGQTNREVEEDIHLERAARPVAERHGARVFEDEHRHRARRPQRNDLLHSRRFETPEHCGLMQERGDRRRIRLARFDRFFDEGAAIRPDRSGHDEPAPAMDLPRLRRCAPLFRRTLHGPSSRASMPWAEAVAADHLYRHRLARRAGAG